MDFEVEYYHSRVLAAIEAWPVDVLADYARLVELLVEHGPSLRLPYSSQGSWGRASRASPARQVRDRACVLLLSGREACGYRPRVCKENRADSG